MYNTNLTNYFKNIEAITKLLENEEVALLYLLPNKGACLRLIEGYIWLVPQLVLRYSDQGIDTEDLISVGNIALVTAANAYTGPANRSSFRGYLIKSINHALYDELHSERAQRRVKLTVKRDR